MKRIFKILGIVLMLLVVFSSCKKSDIEKANKDYDFGAIVPALFAINGPTAVVQTQLVEYMVFPRGGSTFSWTVVGATKQNIEGVTYKIKVLFADTGVVTISVVETTEGGISSESFSKTVNVGPFCTLDINTFLGAFDCDEEGYGVYPVNFTLDPNDPFTIINDNFWDWASPGEIIKYILDGSIDQVVTVPMQTFMFGDGIIGYVVGNLDENGTAGVYNTCDSTMICDYDVEYDGDIYPTHHEFKPFGSKSLITIGKKKSQWFNK